LSRATELVGQAIWASAGQFAQALLAVIGTIVIARLLGAEAIGVFALGLLFIGFAEILIGGHAVDIVVQKEDLSNAHLNASFVTLVGIGSLTSLVLWASAGWAARFFEVPELTWVLAAMMVLPFLTALTSVPSQLLIRRLQFQVLAQIGSLAALCALVIGVVLAASGAGIWSLVLMEILRRLLTLALIARAARWSPGLGFSKRELFEVWRFGLRRIENYGLTFFSQNAMPRLVVGYWLGTEALGIFVVARRLLDQLTNVLSGPVAAVAFPAASRLQSDNVKLVQLIRSSIRLTTWVFWPLVLGIVVTAPLLVLLAFGEQWVAVTPVLQILALGTLRVPVSSLNRAVLVAFKRMGALTFVSILSIVVGLVFLAVGVQYGLAGVAVALTLRQWVLWPVGSHQIYKVSGLRSITQLQVMILAALPALVMVAGVAVSGRLITLDPPWLKLAALVGIGVVIYGVVWAAFNRRPARFLLAALADLRKGDLASAKRNLVAIVRE
jgi:O-antigen/teichoic acid export membrane protein